MRQQSLHLAGAASAGCRSLGARAHLIETRQLVRRNRRQDGALADAIAAADLGRIRQRLDAGRLSAIADDGAEHQCVPQRRNIRSVADHVEYQALSRASPYSTAPISLSSRTTSFLCTPRQASRNTMSSVFSSPMKSPAENMSMPVTFSRVPVTAGT